MIDQLLILACLRTGSWIFRSSDKRLILKRIRAPEKDNLVEHGT